jgi:hypothetical protein
MSNISSYPHPSSHFDEYRSVQERNARTRALGKVQANEILEIMSQSMRPRFFSYIGPPASINSFVPLRDRILQKKRNRAELLDPDE